MYRLHDVKAALILQRFRQNRMERISMLRTGQGNLRAEHVLDDFLRHFLHIFGEEQRIVDIGGTSVKAGEHEAQHRGCHRCLGCIAVEMAVVGIIPQLRLAVLHGTDGAEHIVEHGIGAFIQKIIVLGLLRNVVGIRAQQNQPVHLLGIQTCDDFLIQLVPHFLILAGVLAHIVQELVVFAAGDLLVGELQTQKILAQRSAKRSPEQRHELFQLNLRHQSHGFVEFCNDFFIVI